MNTTRKALLSALVVGVLGSVVALGAFSAFSSTDVQPGNTFTAGTVAIEDNDSDGALYQLTNQKPGTTTNRCIQVTYTGLAGLHRQAVLLGGRRRRAVRQPDGHPRHAGRRRRSRAAPGSPRAARPCTTARSRTSPARTSFANGLPVDGPNAAAWATGEDVVYQFSTSVQDDNNAQGATSGTHSFTWEAQNN